MKAPKLDRRQERTRTALLQAFRDLVLKERYDAIDIADIAARAKVSRSTFYQHFQGKNGILAASIAGPFARLAATLGEAHETRELEALLEHFWSNRSLARVLLTGPLKAKTVVVLVRQIEQILDAAGDGRRGRLILPKRLAAVQLAEVLLAPITAWLAGESRCAAPVLARALARVGRSALSALRASGR